MRKKRVCSKIASTETLQVHRKKYDKMIKRLELGSHCTWILNMSRFFFMFNGLRWEVIVFVDIGGIVDNHC